MKKKRLILFLLVFPVWLYAQQDKGQIWLANSRGESVGESDSVVARNFFDADWVDVRADFMIDQSIDCWLVIMPGDAGAAKAYKISNQELYPNVLEGITNQAGDAKLLLLFQPGKNQVSDLKKNKLEFRLL